MRLMEFVSGYFYHALKDNRRVTFDASFMPPTRSNRLVFVVGWLCRVFDIQNFTYASCNGITSAGGKGVRALQPRSSPIGRLISRRCRYSMCP